MITEQLTVPQVEDLKLMAHFVDAVDEAVEALGRDAARAFLLAYREEG